MNAPLFSTFQSSLGFNKGLYSKPVSPLGDEKEIRYAMLWCGAAMFGLALIIKLLSKSFRTSLLRPGSAIHHAIDTLAVCLLFFAISILHIVFLKWFLYFWEGGFRFPLLVATTQMTVKAVLSWVLVRFSSSFQDAPHITSRVWWWYALPVGVATALDLALSSIALLFISVVFYTILKTSSLIFVLIFSVAFAHQPPSYTLLFVVVGICLGVVMATAGETRFRVEGFVLCLFSSMFAGFRWAMTQSLLQHLTTHLNLVVAISTTSPVSALILVPFVLAFEARDITLSHFFESYDVGFPAFCLMVLSGLFAFALMLIELALIDRTSSLTLGVTGYVKEILQIVLAVVIFGDHLSLLNMCGIVVALVAVAAYVLAGANQDTQVFASIHDAVSNSRLGSFALRGGSVGAVKIHDEEADMDSHVQRSRKQDENPMILRDDFVVDDLDDANAGDVIRDSILDAGMDEAIAHLKRQQQHRTNDDDDDLDDLIEIELGVLDDTPNTKSKRKGSAVQLLSLGRQRDSSLLSRTHERS
eukprot:c11941_g1_i1.p1 GENE.c11941_g1_i1~~c11941_g1_i1.p1  ORF type:complete len:529 (+),score=137.88 c11941_g1_i1:103-1689(+)